MFIRTAKRGIRSTQAAITRVERLGQPDMLASLRGTQKAWEAILAELTSAVDRAA